MDDGTIEADDLVKNLSPVKYFLSTGCTILDLAIADKLPGGFPAGRITQVYGDESTAKTVLGFEALGSAQRQGGLAEMDDIEGTADLERARDLHGVNVSDHKLWRYRSVNSKLPPSSSVEDLFDKNIVETIALAKNLNGPSCRVTDSLSSLPSETEKADDLKDATYGSTRAKQFSTAFRKYVAAMADANLASIFIDQTRVNIGITFGDKNVTSGGKALKFYASVRLLLNHVDKIKNSKDKVIGVRIGFLTKKNKIAPPFRDGEFRILFDYGIDDVGSSVEWLRENDTDLTEKDKKSSQWKIKNLDIAGNGMNDLCKKIEEKGLEKALAKEVERVWRIAYAPIERKPRVRFGN